MASKARVPMARPALFHRRPVLLDGRPKVTRHAVAEGFAGIASDAVCKPVKCSRSPGLFSRHVFCLVKLLPYNNHSEGEQHCVEHANDCKREAGNLVVDPQPFGWHAPANEDRGEHCQERRRADEKKS